MAAHEEVARCLAQALGVRPAGILSDLDGTLSEIAPTPQAAVLAPAVRRALAALRRRLELVAIVSGRPVGQTRTMVGVAGVEYVGNHGLESWRRGRVQLAPEATAAVAEVAAALGELAPELAAWPGVRLEDKGPTAAVHYRLAPDWPAARRAIVAALRPVAARRGLRLVEGRAVVELRPDLDLDKGSAVLALARRYALRSAVYLGDDTTDLDAFAALRRWATEEGNRAVLVAVAGPDASAELAEAADLVLPSVAAVAEVLVELERELEAKG